MTLPTVYAFRPIGRATATRQEGQRDLVPGMVDDETWFARRCLARALSTVPVWRLEASGSRTTVTDSGSVGFAVSGDAPAWGGHGPSLRIAEARSGAAISAPRLSD